VDYQAGEQACNGKDPLERAGGLWAGSGGMHGCLLSAGLAKHQKNGYMAHIPWFAFAKQFAYLQVWATTVFVRAMFVGLFVDIRIIDIRIGKLYTSILSP